MENATTRIARLSPEKRALLELALNQQDVVLPAQQLIPRRANRGPAPLSFAQQRLWFLSNLEPGNTAYNQAKAVRLRGELDVENLNRALNALVERHEILRTTLHAADYGTPIQHVDEPRPLDLPLVDLTSLSHRDGQAELQKRLDEITDRPFDLTRDLMLRAALLKLGAAEHVLVLVTHHVASDGWSSGILSRELAALYQAFLTGDANPLPDLPIQYADFTVWQRNWLQGAVLQNHIAYWKNQLDGASTLLLPTDRPRPAVQSHRGATQSLLLPKALTGRLHGLSRQEGVTLFMTLLAAFQTLLYRYSGQEDIALGSPIAGRTRSETEGLIGCFVNTLVLRSDLSGNPSFRQLLERVKQTALAAYAHQELPFEKLVEELHPDRDLSHNPIFQVLFTHHNVPRQPLGYAGLVVSPVEIAIKTVKFDLSLDTWEDTEGLNAAIEYSTDLFDAPTATRMLGHFQTLLEAIVANPNQNISGLAILSATERRQLLIEWNGVAKEYGNDKCAHQLIEEQVAKTPNDLAVVCGDERLTYRELNHRANQLAHYLQKLGIGPDQTVGICLDHSVSLMVGLLGVLKAGAAYVPLDPDYPKNRLEFILEDTQARVLLTQERLKDLLPKYTGRKLALDSEWREVAAESEENPQVQVTTNNLAYVIFTSGSTGKPKGVMIEHGGLTNYLNYCVSAYPIHAGRGSLVHSSIAFDATITGLFAPLIVGRAVYLLPKSDDLEALANMLRQLRDFSLVKITPVHLALLGRQIPAEEAKGLTHCFVIGGENLLAEQISFWQDNAPATLLINEYGPTENVVGCIVYEASRWPGSGSVPIGRAIPNTTAYVLDRNMLPIPIGVLGELYLGGAGVARGYLNHAELTREKFIADPFSAKPGARLYRTGDLARYLADGKLEFAGRIDHQVKLRGYRIELGEIEAVLCQHPAIRDAAVLARQDTPEDKRLVGYFVSNQQPAPTINDLRNFLSKQLPDYMLPSAFVILETLPRTVNGKLDRKALSALEHDSPESKEAFVAPRNDFEYRLTKIWESILGIPPFSIKDNFFDLGGHSLLAVKLFAEIEKITGRKIPLSVLFQAPTVEQLAGIVRLEVDAAPYASLVSIQPKGSKPPCFLVHGGNGSVLYFAELARHMDADQPLYALQSPGIDGEQEPLTEIEAIAAHYVDEIRTVQPEGPYHLVGLCMGGTVVFEMGQQLLAQGREVALLILLESPRPRRTSLLGSLVRRFQQEFNFHVVDRFAYHGRNLKKLGNRERVAYFVEKLNVAKERVVSRLSVGKPSTKADSMPAHRAEVLSANMHATRKYEPKPYPGRITLFLAHDSPVESPDDSRLAWGELADRGVEVHTIPGDHTNMVWDPQVKGLAAKLKECIDSALSSTNPN